MDSVLSMRMHIGKVFSVCFYHLRRLRQLHYAVSKSTMQRLISALVLVRIDCCNSIPADLPAITLAPFKRVMNAAVRLVARVGVRDHVTPALRELSVTFRVQYKLCLIVHASVNDRSPEYTTDVLVPMSSLQGRATMRSSARWPCCHRYRTVPTFVTKSRVTGVVLMSMHSVSVSSDLLVPPTWTHGKSFHSMISLSSMILPSRHSSIGWHKVAPRHSAFSHQMFGSTTTARLRSGYSEWRRENI